MDHLLVHFGFAGASVACCMCHQERSQVSKMAQAMIVNAQPKRVYPWGIYGWNPLTNHTFRKRCTWELLKESLPLASNWPPWHHCLTQQKRRNQKL